MTLNAAQLTELIEAVVCGIGEFEPSKQPDLTREDILEVTLRWRLYQHAGVDPEATGPFERKICGVRGTKPARRGLESLCEDLRSSAVEKRELQINRVLAKLPGITEVPTLKDSGRLIRLGLIEEADTVAKGLSKADLGRYRVVKARILGDHLAALREQQANFGIVPAELSNLQPVPEEPMVPDITIASDLDIGVYLRSLRTLDRWENVLLFGWHCRHRVRNSEYLATLFVGFWPVFKLTDPDWRTKLDWPNGWEDFTEPDDEPEDWKILPNKSRICLWTGAC